VQVAPAFVGVAVEQIHEVGRGDRLAAAVARPFEHGLHARETVDIHGIPRPVAVGLAEGVVLGEFRRPDEFVVGLVVGPQVFERGAELQPVVADHLRCHVCGLVPLFVVKVHACEQRLGCGHVDAPRFRGARVGEEPDGRLECADDLFVELRAGRTAGFGALGLVGCHRQVAVAPRLGDDPQEQGPHDIHLRFELALFVFVGKGRLVDRFEEQVDVEQRFVAVVPQPCHIAVGGVEPVVVAQAHIALVLAAQVDVRPQLGHQRPLSVAAVEVVDLGVALVYQRLDAVFLLEYLGRRPVGFFFEEALASGQPYRKCRRKQDEYLFHGLVFGF